MIQIPLVALILFFASATAFGGEIISLDTKVSYVSKYMWRGFDVLDGDPAVQPEMTLGFGDTGIYMGVWASYALRSRSEWEIWDEWDYYAGYSFGLLKGTSIELGIDMNYTYFHYPEQNKYVDSQEVALAFKMPALLAVEETKFIPYGGIYRSFEAHHSDLQQRAWWVKLGMEVKTLLPVRKDQELTMYAETFHNDGAATMETDSGFSHIATGAKTSFDIAGFSLTPGINYQWTLEETVNPENEFWFTISIGRSF